MARNIVLVLVVIWISVIQAQAQEQFVFASINGAVQGNISAGANSVESIGKRAVMNFIDQVTVFGYNDETEVPTVQNGMTSARRVLKPVTLLKLVDSSSPLLEQAINNGETLDISVSFYRLSAESGAMEVFFTKEFQSCLLVEVKKIMLNQLDTPNQDFPLMEEISFVYTSVTTKHEVAGTSATVSN